MNPAILIVGLVAVLAYVLEKQHSAVATNTMPGAPANSGFALQGFGPATPTAITGQGALMGVSVASSAAGVVVSEEQQLGNLAATSVPIIGAAIGAVTQIVGALLQAHDARLKGATAENKIVGAMIPIQRKNLQTILDGVSSGKITPSQGIAYVQQVEAAFWANLPPSGPGVAGTRSRSGCSSAPISTWPGLTYGAPGGCGKGCTVGCCVGCTWIVNSTNKTIGMLQGNLSSPQTITAIPGDKYGMPNFPAVTLTYKPPTNVATTSFLASMGL